jgi:hypothetical protein
MSSSYHRASLVLIIISINQLVPVHPAQHTQTPQAQIMPPNTENAHNKYNSTIICNFSQVEFTTP